MVHEAVRCSRFHINTDTGLKLETCTNTLFACVLCSLSVASSWCIHSFLQNWQFSTKTSSLSKLSWLVYIYTAQWNNMGISANVAPDQRFIITIKCFWKMNILSLSEKLQCVVLNAASYIHIKKYLRQRWHIKEQIKCIYKWK